MIITLPPPVSHRRGIFITPAGQNTLGGLTTIKPIPTMTHPPPPASPPTLPTLDATCDRIIANLTRRLAQAAQQIETTHSFTAHDFLVPVLDPDLTESESNFSARP